MIILWLPSLLLSIGLSVGLTILLNAILRKYRKFFIELVCIETLRALCEGSLCFKPFLRLQDAQVQKQR